MLPSITGAKTKVFPFNSVVKHTKSFCRTLNFFCARAMGLWKWRAAAGSEEQFGDERVSEFLPKCFFAGLGRVKEYQGHCSSFGILN